VKLWTKNVHLSFKLIELMFSMYLDSKTYLIFTLEINISEIYDLIQLYIVYVV